MIAPSYFFKQLSKKGLRFFAGVPDSLLKDFCAYVSDNAPHTDHIITANEGNAVALATGHYLATGKPAVVYMQNSGLGNSVNPLTSLASSDVYSIPMLLLVGWRGEPGVHDEPQHKQMGRIQLSLLKALEIPYVELGKTPLSVRKAIEKALKHLKKNVSPFAIVLKKGDFEPYTLKTKQKTNYQLTREQAIKILLPFLQSKDVMVATTGMTSREIFELREGRSEKHSKDFLCVGNMGHTSSLALGVALSQPKRRVWCFDGDGSLIMHMGSLAIIGQQQSKNLIHLVFNNMAHDSVGGQTTAAGIIDFKKLALSCNYKNTYSVVSSAQIRNAVDKALKLSGPTLIEIKCSTGARKDLGRPTITPQENKKAFMKFLKDKR